MRNVTEQRVNVVSGLCRRLQEPHAVTTGELFADRRRDFSLRN